MLGGEEVKAGGQAGLGPEENRDNRDIRVDVRFLLPPCCSPRKLNFGANICMEIKGN